MPEQYVKITSGYVKQLFMIQADGQYQCVRQEFVADNSSEYEEPDGTKCDPPSNETYHPFSMETPEAAKNIHGVCCECKHAFDDNKGKDMCKTCEEWYKECGIGRSQK